MRKRQLCGFVGYALLSAGIARSQGSFTVRPVDNVIAANVSGQLPGGARLEVAAPSLGGTPTERVRFKVESIDWLSGVRDFLVISPSAATTPAEIGLAVNPAVIRHLQPGFYRAFVRFATVDRTPAEFRTITVVLTVRSFETPPAIAAVVNAASRQPTISPGGMVTILGESLGPPLHSATFGTDGLYPSTYGNVTVRFGQTEAPVLSVSPDQITTVAPESLAGQSTTDVTISRYRESATLRGVPVADAAPGIFTFTPGGSTQGVPLNYRSAAEVTPNGADNPAPPGSAVVLFATGFGGWADGVNVGAIGLLARPFTLKPLSLTIGGETALLFYAGAAPYQSVGMLQLNARIPAGLAPGPQPVVLTIGGADNTAQRAIIYVGN